ncbi:MAG TPA: DNA cytosine methyltransferase [Tepidisphaeraceae bacterium]|nr:DNA cytosine methyltransferase [Tepidisphaeraceae bacterium]
MSLFDGLGGTRLALHKLGITPTNYFSSEIDRHAMAVSAANFADIEQIGDVCKVAEMPVPIDLMVFGSPCTDLSSLNRKKEGLKGQHSSLFYEALRILREVKPRFWMMENVASMSKVNRDAISAELGVEPVLINSALMTAQRRRRYYWCNWQVTQPEDHGIRLADILDPEHFRTYPRYRMMDYKFKDGRTRWDQGWHNDTDHDKAGALTTACRGDPSSMLIDRRHYLMPIVRRFTPHEVERLQGVPDDYTAAASESQRYRMLGNGFTIPVIAHLLAPIAQELKGTKARAA